MGVTGLLPQLKEIQQNVSLEKFRGKTIAIDSYAWLHRGVFSCSWELAQDMATDRYISYFQRRIKMLEHFGVTPYFVFDGDDFNSKSGTESDRARGRLMNKERGMQCLANGDKKSAHSYFTKCVDVTPQMAKSVIEYLKSVNIKYIVAPYEADPQMVYLENLGLVDAIISEDSDLLVFGAKILLTKLNEFGECIEINRDDFKKCKNVPIGLMNQDQLRIVACLSGCDYTNGIPNVGIVKALRLVRRIPNMKRCISCLKLLGKVQIPPTFELEYEKANLSFQFQRVFNPIDNKISTLYEPTELDMRNSLFQECTGILLENETHKKIAYGDLDPITKEHLVARDDFIKRDVILTQFTKSKAVTQSFPVKSNAKASSTPIIKVHSSNNGKIAYGDSDPITKEHLVARGDDFIKRDVTLAQFTKSKAVTQSFPVKSNAKVFSTPTIKKSIKIQSIESFFKIKTTASDIKPSVAPTPIKTSQCMDLSPTSKRRRLFNSTPKATTTSKFFRSSTDPISTTTDTGFESPLISKARSSQQYEHGPVKGLEFQSSDFELTDIDDEDDELSESETPEQKEQASDSDLQISNNSAEPHNSEDANSCQIADDSVDIISLDETHESPPPNTERLLETLDDNITSTGSDDTVVGPEKVVAKSLYEKFALSSGQSSQMSELREANLATTKKAAETAGTTKMARAAEKVPLQPIHINVQNKPRTTLVKSGGSILTNATLDHFIYRG